MNYEFFLEAFHFPYYVKIATGYSCDTDTTEDAHTRSKLLCQQLIEEEKLDNLRVCVQLAPDVMPTIQILADSGPVNKNFHIQSFYKANSPFPSYTADLSDYFEMTQKEFLQDLRAAYFPKFQELNLDVTMYVDVESSTAPVDKQRNEKKSEYSLFSLPKRAFRGWSPTLKKYVYGGVVHDRTGEWYIIPQLLTPIHVLKQSVGQSTCIMDGCGRTIFEGDTIRCKNGKAALIKLGRFIHHEWIDTDDQFIAREEYGWYLQPLDTPNISVRFNPNAWLYCEVIPKSYWIPSGKAKNEE